MSRFDLSKAADFSIVTQQNIRNTAALLGGKNPNDWDIVEAKYNDVLIHVFISKSPYQASLPTVTDKGGRRIVDLVYPYRDGQTTDDLGRKGNEFSFDFMIFGLRYYEGLTKILAAFNTPAPATLVHPIRGEFKVKCPDYQILYQHDSRKCAHFTATFVEHNFTIGSPRQLQDSSVKGALASALAIFQIIDTALAKIEAAQLLIRGVKIALAAMLAAYKATNASTLSQMNATFNTRGGNADLPAILPTNAGGLRNPNGTVASDNFIVVRSPNDPFSSVPTESLSAEVLIATALNNLTKQVIARREELAEILRTISEGGGDLELYDTIVELRSTAVLLQDVLERGAASSNARIVDYVIPRVMSLREAAFLNGIDPDRVGELDLLNPFLLSTNYIDPGVVIKVPAT